MKANRRICALKFVEGIVTSASAHLAAWATVAMTAFLWQFFGHVVADAGFRLIVTLIGY